MSKNCFYFLLLLFLVLLLIPEQTKGDAIVAAPLPTPPPVILPEPVQLVQVPSMLVAERVPYFLMVMEEFPDAPVMARIAMAESGFKPWIKNPNSSASGLFQILKGTWKLHGCTGDVFDPKDNIACARKIYDDSGTTPWNESRSAWE